MLLPKCTRNGRSIFLFRLQLQVGQQQVNKADSNIDKLLKWIARRINVYPVSSFYLILFCLNITATIAAIIHVLSPDDECIL